MSLFLNMSNILAVFNVSKPLDKNGMEVEPNIAWSTGPTMFGVNSNRLLYTCSNVILFFFYYKRHLGPFECQIKPRSKQHLMLIR